jgi:prophage regulatory protein
MQSNVVLATAKDAANVHPIRFLRIRATCERTGLSRSQIYRLVALGQFPKHVKLTETCSAWIEEEVDRWAAERIAASRGAAA